MLIVKIHKAKYIHSQWYYHFIPRRLTLKSNHGIYKWLFWVFSKKVKTGNNFKCLGGDDCTLNYVLQCQDCKTIVVDDHSNDFTLTNWKCPVCVKQKCFGFEYFTKWQQLVKNAKEKIIQMSFKINEKLGWKIYKWLIVSRH